jgi:phospholipid transport system substrate-binding protein
MISLLSRYLFIFFLAFSSFTLRAEQPNLLAPQRVIAEASVKLLAQLEDPNFSQDKKQIRHYIDQEIFPQVDTILMSALVLGKHWRKASKMQQREFIRAFKQLLVNTYAATFTEQFHNWTIRYSPLKLKDSDKKILVKTRVRQAGKPDTRIDYSMVFVCSFGRALDSSDALFFSFKFLMTFSKEPESLIIFPKIVRLLIIKLIPSTVIS